jgi:toxin YhaV
MVIVNGWTIYGHPLFLGQLEKLTRAVDTAKAKDPKGYHTSANAKLLKALHAVAFERIPQDPTAPRYRQGATLGDTYKHWFREKFGNGRFRLFFRYDSKAKVIVYAWVNDENTLRTYGAKTDAYAVFASMLDNGNPPDNWAALLQASSNPETLDRLLKSGK